MVASSASSRLSKFRAKTSVSAGRLNKHLAKQWKYALNENRRRTQHVADKTVRIGNHIKNFWKRNNVTLKIQEQARSSLKALCDFDKKFHVSDAMVTTACTAAVMNFGSGLIVAGATNIAAAAISVALVRRREEERGESRLRSRTGRVGRYHDIALTEDFRRRRGS